jgi:hypothetical protein
MGVDTKETIKEPLEFAPLDGIIQLLIEERIKEETLGEQLKLESRTINKKPDDIDGLLSDEEKLFLSNQAERHKAIINYIQKALNLAQKCKKYSPDDLKTFDKLLACEIGRLKIEIPDEKEIDSKKVWIIITPPIALYIKEKYETLCKLHYNLARSSRLLPLEKVNFKNINDLSKENRSALESLLRHFEAGADKYPYLTHCVLSWPFLRKMPKPPGEYINERIKRFLEKYNSYTYNFLVSFGSSPFITEQTLAKDWFDGHKDSVKGLQRFYNLATEAGQLLWAIMTKENTKTTSELLRMEFANIWLFSIHNLRETHVTNDGWDGLFDDDSDFCDESWRKGLYIFRYTNDIFYESMRLCTKLLDSERGTAEQKGTEKPEKAIPKEIELMERLADELLKWTSKPLFPKSPGREEEQLEKYASEPYEKNHKKYVGQQTQLFCILGGDFDCIVNWLKWHKAEIGKDIDEKRNKIRREFESIVHNQLHSNNYELATATMTAEGYAGELAKSLLHIARLAREGEKAQSGITETRQKIKDLKTSKQQKKNRKTKLKIDEGGLNARLNGKSYKITDRQMDFLKELLNKREMWVSGKTLRKHNDERVDKIKNSLPSPIRKLIQSHTRNGYRLVLK